MRHYDPLRLEFHKTLENLRYLADDVVAALEAIPVRQADESLLEDAMAAASELAGLIRQEMKAQGGQEE
jgi:hypothetical protein